VRFILRFKRRSKRATNANKIIINKRKVRDNTREAREIEVKARKIEANIEIDAKVDAKTTTTITTTITTTTNKKQLLKLCEQFACTHVNFVFETILILLSCLLLFNNLQKYTSNTLYN